MTEEEARKKWCPMVRFIMDRPAQGNLVSNRNCTVNDPWDKCIASDCMMWRWMSKIIRDKGYCGLGGEILNGGGW